ncbi:MAG: iron-containing alcohol dehydrogenase [Actinobacteria bacterium]|nr:iron-containing alcohol dehydrogenase [Actinomycetota bacterium]
MDSPQIFVYEASDDESDASVDLAAQVGEVGIQAPFVVSSMHGQRLALRTAAAGATVTPPSGATKHYSIELGAHIRRSRADGVVAVGGGRVLDVAKLAAARAGLTLIAVPTQLSHDGICSPVAVVPDDSGMTQSLGAIPPRTVYLSIPTLVKAPVASVRAGLGDLMANPLALRDWALASERGLASTDQRAWDLSAQSFDMIQGYLSRDASEFAHDPKFLRHLADALVMSGMSMIISGTSRPASGAEHEISHAIDALFGGRALHGAQVAFGCIVSVALYGEDFGAFRRQLALVGLPHHPRELRLTEGDVVRVILESPETRPGRFTIIEEANLDEAGALKLVRRIWGSANGC